jgi:transcriptional regulator with XRE-family HTH domain
MSRRTGERSEFALLLRQRMAERNVNIEQLADRVGVGRNAIGDWRARVIPRPHAVAWLVEALALPPEQADELVRVANDGRWKKEPNPGYWPDEVTR